MNYSNNPNSFNHPNHNKNKTKTEKRKTIEQKTNRKRKEGRCNPLELSPSLKSLKARRQWRHLKKTQGKDFASNDYLSLSKNQELRQEWMDFLETQKPPLSASASRLIAGHHHLHEEVEKELCDFFESESGLLFNSGYVANQGVLSCLAKEGGEGTVVFSDELNHASIIDGIALSKAKCEIFQHRDMNHLEALLKKHSQEKQHQEKGTSKFESQLALKPKSKGALKRKSTLDSQPRSKPPSPLQRRIVVSESLFSMDGDIAPLSDLYNLSLKYGAFLLLDEAHAGGVLGPRGKGQWLSFQRGLTSPIPPHLVRIFTFGKAFGAYGAFVACSLEMRHFLVNFCRPFIFSTALPPTLLGLLQRAVRWVGSSKGDALRTQLHTKTQFLHQALSPLCPLGTSSEKSPILPLILGNKEKVLSLSQALWEEGSFEVPAIRYPSVAKGQERLRLSLHAQQSWKDLHLLVDLIKKRRNF